MINTEFPKLLPRINTQVNYKIPMLRVRKDKLRTKRNSLQPKNKKLFLKTKMRKY